MRGVVAVCMRVLLLAVLFSAGTSAESIAPRHGVLESDTTFVIEDVEFSYTTCKTTFNGEERQSVFGSIINSTQPGNTKALCVVRVPFLDEEHPSLDAHIEVSQARGPRSKPERTTSFSVPFSQSPVVETGTVQYASGQRFGSVVVHLTQIAGILKGGDALRELLQLSIDLSVLKRSVLRLSLDSFKDVGGASYLIFKLPEFLPSGRYPCVLTINGNPLPLAAPEAPAVASTRTADQFNASDTAQAAPLLQPAREHTFLINVDLPIVKLLPQSAELRQAQCGLDDYDDSGDGASVSEHCPLVAVGDELTLAVNLEGPLFYEASALVALFPAGMPVEDVTHAARQFDGDWSRDWQHAVVADRVELPLPTESEPVSLQWLRWDAKVVRERVITFKQQDEEEAVSTAGVVVMLVDTVGAVAGPEQRSAFVSSSSDAVLPMDPPEFSVAGQQVLHRQGDLSFELIRSGKGSPLQSVVQWRVVYLNQPTDTVQEEALLPGTVGTLLEGSPFGRHRSNISAVLNSTGTVTWPAQSTDHSKMVTVPINWSAVPYVTRWMLVVQLSILFNGKLANDVFTLLTVPPPSSESPATTLEDQLVVLSPAVAGVTSSLATSTNAIVYGVEEGVCPPGTGRMLGTANSVPLPEVLGEPGIHSMMLQVQPEGEDADGMLWMPSSPLFNCSTHSYELTIPFGYTNARIVIATSAEGHYWMSGCDSSSAEPLTAPVSRLSIASPNESDEKGNAGGNLRQLIWPLVQPEGSQCTSQVHVCSPDTSSPVSCAEDTEGAVYSATITWLQDPMLAVIDAVNVTLGGHDAVRVCSSDSEHAAAEHACLADARVRPGANSSHALCSVSECGPHSVVSAGLTYMRGEQIQIAVQPVHAVSVHSVSIGQRVFPVKPGSTLGEIGVTFTLFDSSDRLSPFVPFFIRWRSKGRTLLDVPITLTLIDGRTSVLLNLMLDIDVQQPPPPPPAPPPPTAADGNATFLETGEAAGGRDAPPVPLLSAGAPVRFVAEGTSVAVVSSSVTASAAPQDGARVVPSDDLADAGGGDRRRLHDVSSSAPHGQQWLGDPLKNLECSVCEEGMFSDSVDSLCRQCQPGTCAPQHGMTECTVCPPGTYSAVHGASSCSPCVHGSYSQLPGSAACRLCPFGYTTTADGASLCNQALDQTVALGKQYALVISLAMRLSGANLEDVAMRTGVLGSSEDILSFLVSLDSAAAFNVSTRDVEVVSIQQVKRQELRVLLTTNIGIAVPPNANKQQLNHAIDVAQLSKDAGIGNLTWTHTSEALGAEAITEDLVSTEVREPDPRERVTWEAIVFPVVAGLVIIGSALMLKIRRSRDNGPIEAVAQTPHLLLSRVLLACRMPVSALFRDRSHLSDVSSDIGIECDEFEVDVHALRPAGTIGKRGNQQPTDMSRWNSEDARKRNEICRDIEL